MKKLDLFLRIAVSVILLQTLFFKFTGAPESVYIFTTLGIEPWGRFFSGAVELVAAVLLLLPSTVLFGAALSFGTMLGAIGGHLTKLGIEVQGDGGLLFGLASFVFVSSAFFLFTRRSEVLILAQRLTSRSSKAGAAT